MEELEVLDKLYESISKGPGVLEGIDPGGITGMQEQDVFRSCIKRDTWKNQTSKSYSKINTYILKYASGNT